MRRPCASAPLAGRRYCTGRATASHATRTVGGSTALVARATSAGACAGATDCRRIVLSNRLAWPSRFRTTGLKSRPSVPTDDLVRQIQKARPLPSTFAPILVLGRHRRSARCEPQGESWHAPTLPAVPSASGIAPRLKSSRLITRMVSPLNGISVVRASTWGSRPLRPCSAPGTSRCRASQGINGTRNHPCPPACRSRPSCPWRASSRPAPARAPAP